MAAIFHSGMFEYDSKFAYIDLEEGQRFFGTGDSVTAFELKVHETGLARTVMGRVRCSTSAAGRSGRGLDRAQPQPLLRPSRRRW